MTNAMTNAAKTCAEVRSQVSDAYAVAIAKASGCCDGAASCGDDGLDGVAAKLAGYSEEAREHAEVSSFGCGNPLAFSEVEAGQTVLDLGSGAGFDLLIAAKQVGPEGG